MPMRALDIPEGGVGEGGDAGMLWREVASDVPPSVTPPTLCDIFGPADRRAPALSAPRRPLRDARASSLPLRFPRSLPLYRRFFTLIRSSLFRFYAPPLCA
eukprot:ctg_471.g273